MVDLKLRTTLVIFIGNAGLYIKKILAENPFGRWFLRRVILSVPVNLAFTKTPLPD